MDGLGEKLTKYIPCDKKNIITKPTNQLTTKPIMIGTYGEFSW